MRSLWTRRGCVLCVFTYLGRLAIVQMHPLGFFFGSDPEYCNYDFWFLRWNSWVVDVVHV